MPFDSRPFSLRDFLTRTGDELFGIQHRARRRSVRADNWNPAGYIQRPDITAFNTRLIQRAGGSVAVPPDPNQIVSAVPDSVKHEINLAWTRREGAVLLKDPRFSVTAQYWIRSQMVPESDFEILHISRRFDSAVRSCLLHYDVKEYVQHSADEALKTLQLYDEYAAWHVRTMNVHSTHVSYEDLLSRPIDTIERLANFARCDDVRLIARAVDATKVGQSRIPTDSDHPL